MGVVQTHLNLLLAGSFFCLDIQLSVCLDQFVEKWSGAQHDVLFGLIGQHGTLGLEDFGKVELLQPIS
jgi:hypothetical protein